VVPFGQFGRFDPGTPIVSGHSGPVLDFEFNPFHDQLVASASEDSTVKVRHVDQRMYAARPADTDQSALRNRFGAFQRED
jgi:WD40 repeat protein